MADGLTFTGLRDAYAAASPARKLVGGLVILLLLALPLGLSWVDVNKPREYRVLFSELSDRDGGEVVEALEQLNIPYRLTEADGSIQVPVDQLHIARYKLAAQGLPRGDKPVEENAGPRFGVSSFQEQVGYQRGLETQLAHSVESLDSIESARVHLAIPRQSAFLREQIPPAASVLVVLKHGAELTEGQVEALRQIVAGGVPGLSPGQVSVVDQSGSLLAAGVAGFYRGLSPDQMEYARRLESDLAGRIERVLAPVLGDRAFKVQVTVKVGFSESEETIESSRRTSTLAGTVDRSVRHVRGPRGSVEQVSSLIVVDEHAALEAGELDRLAVLARQAVGFDSARGDNLQVIMLPFSSAVKPAVAPVAKPLRKIPVAAPAAPGPALFEDELLPVYAGLVLALLLFMLLISLRVRQRRRQAEEERRAEMERQQAGEQLDARLDSLRQRVLADPRVAASVVKTWMQGA